MPLKKANSTQIPHGKVKVTVINLSDKVKLLDLLKGSMSLAEFACGGKRSNHPQFFLHSNLLGTCTHRPQG
jgi:hypothetical protein